MRKLSVTNPKPSGSDVPDDSLESARTLMRFMLRLAILSAFAMFGGEGFGRTLAALLLFGSFYCAVAALIRGDHPGGRVLCNWDESAAYGAIAMIAFAAS